MMEKFQNSAVYSALLFIAATPSSAQSLFQCTIISSCGVEAGNYDCSEDLDGMNIHIFEQPSGNEWTVFVGDEAKDFARHGETNLFVGDYYGRLDDSAETWFMNPERDAVTYSYLTADGSLFHTATFSCTEAS